MKNPSHSSSISLNVKGVSGSLYLLMSYLIIGFIWDWRDIPEGGKILLGLMWVDKGCG